MTLSGIYEPSPSTSDSDSLFSPSASSLSSSISSTPRPLEDEPALSAAARQQLLERLLAQMDPAAVKQVEDAAAAVRQQQFDHPPTVRCLERARVSTEHGEAFLYRYVSSADPGKEHLAWVYRGAPLAHSLATRLAGESEDQHKVRGYYPGTLLDPATSQQHSLHARDGIDTTDGGAALVRIHSECFTGDIMGSTRCDCGEQLKEAKRIISQRGGVILYLRQEGRGIGLGEKMKAYNLQDLGVDTVVANQLLGHASDARTFGLATAILEDLGLSEIRLLTNNPDKISSVEGSKRVVRVTERVAMIPLAWQNKPEGIYSKELDRYLHTKRTRMGHLLD